MVDLRVRFLFECVFLELYVLALCLVWPPSLKSSSASPLLLEVASASHYLRKHQVPRPPQASACSIISSLLELQRKPLLQTLASPYFEFDPNHPLKPRLCLEQLPPLERLPRGSIEVGGLLSPCSSYWLLKPLGCGLLELQPCLASWIKMDGRSLITHKSIYYLGLRKEFK